MYWADTAKIYIIAKIMRQKQLRLKLQLFLRLMILRIILLRIL